MYRVIPLSLLHRHQNKKIKRYRQEFVVSGICIVNGKVLLVKRSNRNSLDPGAWALPCGHVEPLETPTQAIIREFKEETNIGVKAGSLVSIEHYFYDRNNVRSHIIEFIYLVQPTGKKFTIRLNKEHSEYRFIPSQELPNSSSLISSRKKAIQKVL